MTPTPGTVTGGVDTHSDIHVAAAVDHLGGVLGTARFRTTTAGYRKLLAVLAPAAGSVHAEIDGVLPGAAWRVTEPNLHPRVRKPAATAGWGPARQDADPRRPVAADVTVGEEPSCDRRATTGTRKGHHP